MSQEMSPHEYEKFVNEKFSRLGANAEEDFANIEAETAAPNLILKLVKENIDKILKIHEEYDDISIDNRYERGIHKILDETSELIDAQQRIFKTYLFGTIYDWYKYVDEQNDLNTCAPEITEKVNNLNKVFEKVYAQFERLDIPKEVPSYYDKEIIEFIVNIRSLATNIFGYMAVYENEEDRISETVREIVKTNTAPKKHKYVQMEMWA